MKRTNAYVQAYACLSAYSCGTHARHVCAGYYSLGGLRKAPAGDFWPLSTAPARRVAQWSPEKSTLYSRGSLVRMVAHAVLQNGISRQLVRRAGVLVGVLLLGWAWPPGVLGFGGGGWASGSCVCGCVSRGDLPSAWYGRLSV